jgi:hypothetical protein
LSDQRRGRSTTINGGWISVTFSLPPTDCTDTYSFDLSKSVEPNYFGNTIPGFGHTYLGHRQFFSLNETHIFDSNVINEARLGFNRQFGTNTPNAQLNPADFDI